METDKDKDPFKRGQRIKSFPFTQAMLDVALHFPTDAQQGRFFRAVARFGLHGADPEGLDASEIALFDFVKAWLGERRLERLAKAENGAKGGQAPKNPASYRGNKNAAKAPPQVSPLEKGRRDAQEGKDTEEAKAYLANTAENAAFATILYFAENLGLPAGRFTFTGAEFEELESKLREESLLKEALFRARAGKFSRLAEWETAKREKQTLKLAPLLKILFAEIETDLAKERAKDATPKETEGGNASTQGPAHPPQNSIQANGESARKLENPVFAAASIRRKFARAFDVPESGVEFDKKAFERCKEKLEAPNTLRRFLRQAKTDAEENREELRKSVFDGGKILLEAYLLALWKYETAFAKAQTPQEKEKAFEFAQGRISIAKPPAQSKTK